MSIADYRAILPFSLLVLCAACERTGEADPTQTGGGGGDPAPLTQAEFVSRFQTLSCQNLKRCCSASGLALDETTCSVIFANAGLGTVGTTYSPVHGTQCIAELEASAQCWFTPGGAACSQVYPGVHAPGEACTFDSDCALPTDGDSFCDLTRGVCAIAVHGQAGDACQRSCERDHYGETGCDWGPASNPTASGSMVDCFANDGLACGAGGRCVALAGLGQICESHISCDRSLFCKGSAGSVANTCQPRGGVGSPCDDSTAPCIGSAYCSAGVCAAKKADGQRCLMNAECSGGVCNCGVGSCATAGVCADRKAMETGGDLNTVVSLYCHA